MSMFDLWDKAVIENEAVILEDIDSMQYSFEDDSHELWVFDSVVVDAVEKKLPLTAIVGYLRDTYSNAYLSSNAYAQLEVYWLEEGTQFVIDEYDGLETLRLFYETDWITA